MHVMQVVGLTRQPGNESKSSYFLVYLTMCVCFAVSSSENLISLTGGDDDDSCSRS